MQRRWCALLLAAFFLACGERSPQEDAGTDAGKHDDAGQDAGRDDAGADAGSDAGVDAGTDAGVDAGTDAGHDAGVDGGTDAGVDAGVDGGTDAGVDAGVDSGTDAGADGGVDAGLDAGADSGTDAGFDGGFDAGPLGTVDGGAGCELILGMSAPFRLRALAANLSSGNQQAYDPGEGQRILQGLQPDLVMIQEFNFGNNSSTDFASFVEATFPDAGYSYTRGSGQIPNGVISRYPIVYAGEWTDPRVSNRTFVWAYIDLPGPRDLWAISVHLLTTSASERDLEAAEILSQLNATVPAAALLVIGGDFNVSTTAEACLQTLQPRVDDGALAPADQAGNSNTNTNRNKPYDHLLTSRCLELSQVQVEIGDAGFDGGLVFDSRVFTPLSDVPPVLATDSAAVGMQHMGVVKDFSLLP